MSVIHAALKKAEEERKNKEPYNLSIDAIVELAKKKKRPEDFKTSVSAALFSKPVQQIKLRRPAVQNFPVKGILLALTGALLLWLVVSIGAALLFRHPAVPSQVPPQKADGLKNVMAKKAAAMSAPAEPEKNRPFQASPLENFVLTGVVTSGGRWSAMINGKLAEVGSTVDGAKVVSIYEGAVTLEKNKKRFTIFLD